MKFFKYREAAKKDEGSMVVEAAMVLPLFLLFVLFLIFMVQMTLYSTALQSTVSDTVKTVSSHMYPAALAAQKWNSGNREETGQTSEPADSPESSENTTESSSVFKWSIPRLSLTDLGGGYASSLPDPIGQWFQNALQKGEGPLQELQAEASQNVLDLAVKPLLKPYVDSDMLEYERIHVSNIVVPVLKDGSRPYFGLEVSYELPMRVPFLNQRIVLEASAVERLWIGDTGEGGSGAGPDEEGAEEGIVILAQPSPGVAGEKGIIRARISPNSAAYLAVFYKTGKSTAKHLGWNQADDEGYIQWEWMIGSNTTPGIWSFVIETADGKSIEVQFTVVAKKKEMEGGNS